MSNLTALERVCKHEWVRAGKRESSPWMCLQCGAVTDDRPASTSARSLSDAPAQQCANCANLQEALQQREEQLRHALDVNRCRCEIDGQGISYECPLHGTSRAPDSKAPLTSKTVALLDEIEAVMRGEHGVDWADHFGPLFQLVEDVRAESPAETKARRIGPDTPDNDLVICPHCTSQFRAVPVNVQAALAERFTETQIREFCGYLTGYLTELGETHPGSVWDGWQSYLRQSAVKSGEKP